MACRGILLALDEAEVARLLAASSDDELMEQIWALEKHAPQALTDKAWDAIHRTLTDGTLELSENPPPLAKAILGGRSLHEGDRQIVCLVGAAEVPEVARALAAIDEAEFRRRYFELIPEADDYFDHSEEDAGYSCAYFADVAEFYAQAAAAGHAVVFQVDQ
jgi:hypothetical protein